MKLDLGSFAFGSSVVTGGNTPSWGTSLGQQRPDLKFTYPGYDNIIIGMMYKSIPINKVFIPLGKGGHVCNSLEDEGIQLAAMFDKVYINEVKVDAPFIMIIYQDGSDSWAGRRTLKYNTRIEYRRGQNDIIYNSTFVTAAKAALQLADDACWVVSDMHIVNQDELHLIAGVVNPNHSESYPSAELRKAAFIDAIKTTYDKHPNFTKKYSSENATDLSSQEILLDTAIQIIFYGDPGTGKSHIVKKQTERESVVRTTFHPDSDYSTFVGCYKPTTKHGPRYTSYGEKAVVIKDAEGKELTEDRIVYEFVDQAFLQSYIKAWKFYTETLEGADPKKQFLIIEEINRGNCAQIFGDLFQLLDRNDYGFSDYYIHADRDMQKHLAKAFNGIAMNDSHKNTINAMYHNGERDIVAQVLNGEILLLPNNLYIWATMNTSDQSLFPIDSAFKRRWDWKYRPIVKGRDRDGRELNWRITANTREYDWWSFLEKINAIVGTTTNSEDKKLGFFFCKSIDGVISTETFVGKVIFYLWNDVFKNFGFDDPIFKDEDGSTLEFDKFYTTDIYGNTIVRTDKVERFLENLKVKVAGEIISEIEDEDGNTSSTSTRDYTKYSINGVGKYGKNILAAECVKEYIKLNPEMSVEDVLANWKSLGYIVTHFVESKEEHDTRTDNSIRSVEIQCGDTFVYVEKNGYGNNGAVDKLIAAVNQKDWNIKIDKVE